MLIDSPIYDKVKLNFQMIIKIASQYNVSLENISSVKLILNTKI